ncbi:hypothetical protein HPP92_026607 [Vanilla planifolia]|uniref:Uncharacterized protein n=1 Tax=Vanilla planifolia TaxID=51239 RepID=A0A835U6Y2_VANPL|nr:hypothetical protein HPP92_026607 [Vanilla planifolia]
MVPDGGAFSPSKSVIRENHVAVSEIFWFMEWRTAHVVKARRWEKEKGSLDIKDGLSLEVMEVEVRERDLAEEEAGILVAGGLYRTKMLEFGIGEEEVG